MAALDETTARRGIRSFIYETYFFGDESETFADSDSFMEKGIIDSTGVLEMTAYLEKKYEITIDDDDLIPVNLDSVDNLIGFITRKLA